MNTLIILAVPTAVIILAVPLFVRYGEDFIALVDSLPGAIRFGNWLNRTFGKAAR